MDELKIIQYLDGEMTGKELEKFEEEIRMDPLLEEEVRKYREIQEMAVRLLSDQDVKSRFQSPDEAEDPGTAVEKDRFQSPDEAEDPGTAVEKEITEAVSDFKRDPGSYADIPDDYREKLMDAEREMHRGRGQQGSISMIRRIWYSAAALIILALTISVLVFKPFATLPAGEIYAQYFRSFNPTDEIIEIARDNNDFLFASEVYKAGDYDRAVVLFEALADSSGLRSWSLFFAGSSYMSLNQTDKAIGFLLAVLDEPDNEVKPAAHWHLSLCYLKKGMPENAREHLVLLSDDHVYRKDANRILKLLR